MAFQVVIDQLNLEHPLNFYSYIGDHDGIEVFLTLENFGHEDVASALSLASLLGHTKCVETILALSDSMVVTPIPLTHAFTQNHPVILMHLLSAMDGDPTEDAIYPGMLWAVHNDYVDILPPVKLRCSSFICNKTLESALLSESKKCVEYLVHNLSERISISNSTFLVKNHLDLFMDAILSKHGAEVDDGLLCLINEKSPSEYQDVLTYLTKKRWRQIRAIGKVVAMWKLHIDELYKPGGGKYKEAARSFHLLANGPSEENTTKDGKTKMC